jgi:hypothetical protein
MSKHERGVEKHNWLWGLKSPTFRVLYRNEQGLGVKFFLKIGQDAGLPPQSSSAAADAGNWDNRQQR